MFQIKMEARFLTLIDVTDELCFVLDPNRDFLTVFKDKDECRRVKREKMDYVREECLFDEKKVGRVMKEFDDFCHQRGQFVGHHYRIDPITFWTQFDDMPIGELALRLFHMMTSSASVERSFSVRSQKRLTGNVRNRLSQARAEKMVAILFSDMDNEQARKRRRATKRRQDADTIGCDDSDDSILFTGPLAMAKAEGDDDFALELEKSADPEDDDAENSTSDQSDEEEGNSNHRKTTIVFAPETEEPEKDHVTVTGEDEDDVPILDADAVVDDSHSDDDNPDLVFKQLTKKSTASPAKRSRLS